jgi:hypothetical protein
MLLVPYINDNGIKELHRKGGKFTWTNKQQDPIMFVLDRIFVSPEWEQHYRLATCESLTRVGSNHCPIILLTKDERVRLKYQFRFEASWLLREGFRDQLLSKWPQGGI